MADILNRSVEYGGSFSSDGLEVTFGDFAGAGFLVQQLGIQYRQQISRIYELGSSRVYVVAGKTQGNASIARLIGPKPLATGFYQKFGDVCKLANNHLAASMKSNSCGMTAGSAMTLRHVLVEALTFNVNAGDFLFNEQSSAMFMNMELNGT